MPPRLLLLLLLLLHVLPGREAGRLLDVVVQDLQLALGHHLPHRGVEHEVRAALATRALLHRCVGRVDHPQLVALVEPPAATAQLVRCDQLRLVLRQAGGGGIIIIIK